MNGDEHDGVTGWQAFLVYVVAVVLVSWFWVGVWRLLKWAVS